MGVSKQVLGNGKNIKGLASAGTRRFTRRFSLTLYSTSHDLLFKDSILAFHGGELEVSNV